MSDNRYSVIFTGQLKPELAVATVASNLVLDLGLAQEKVNLLLKQGRVVLKRCATIVEAQRLAEKLDRAGILCIIEDRFSREASEQGSSGESSLVKLINKFIPSSQRPGTSATSRKG